MRVLIVSHRFYPAEGGSERWALGLARSLRARGDHPIVLTQQEPGLPDRSTLDGIEIRRVELARFGRFRRPRHYLRELRAIDYDVLQLSGNRIWCADFLFPIAPLLSAPRAITPHGFYQLEMDPTSLDRVYFRHYLPFALRSFGAYFSMSEHESQQIVSFGYDAARVHTVGSAIVPQEFAGPRGDGRELRERWGVRRPKIAFTAGGTWENKRIDRIIEGLVPVRDEVALIVAGRDVPASRYNQAALERLAADRGLELHCVGELPRSEFLSALRSVDLYVQGSSYEGFGLTLLEAMASGLPFVAYPTGAAPELAGAGGGSIANTPAEFTQGARALLSEMARGAAACSQRTRLAAERWSWSRSVEQYAQAYRRLVGS
ncbi:MAG: glycosyltransferase family 4 protein [Thermoplasmata archaeon]